MTDTYWLKKITSLEEYLLLQGRTTLIIEDP